MSAFLIVLALLVGFFLGANVRLMRSSPFDFEIAQIVLMFLGSLIGGAAGAALSFWG
jgi:hypothetical protein